ncbi:MAG: deoxyribodipyrimidine photolyase [Deltaproteobacteria bacterium]|nr:deoxyribodipyrimidine photolyase [Deltaproteobacteria bacterium]
MATVPGIRVRPLNDAPVRANGGFVLYWMTAFRRTSWNLALQRAVEWSREVDRPLLIFEALRCDYPWASDRLHRFVLEGMADNRRRCEEAGVAYYPYVEPAVGRGGGLLVALAGHSCAVVADDFPAFFLPRMLRAAVRRLPVRLEAVDANGLLPLRAAGRAFPTAYAFRRFLQKALPEHLAMFPEPEPLEDAGGTLAVVPDAVLDRWPPASPELLAGDAAALGRLPVDHGVLPAPVRGGEAAARERLREFVDRGLARYAEDRNHPDRDATSGLSPYLHFGHLSVHEVFAAVMSAEGWSEDLLSRRADGRRSGWWRASASAEALLDQLITWRELGFAGCAYGEAWDRYESLPAWARATLERHAGDPRPYVYRLSEFEAAATHDPLWNAAQRQLLREGRLHNYLRMLWGKKILEWSPSPRKALEVMLTLNDRYALDGRDPNSVTGILWCLGRHDRAWGPERPVFGTVRFMSSENTRRKVEVRRYLEVYGAGLRGH